MGNGMLVIPMHMTHVLPVDVSGAMVGAITTRTRSNGHADLHDSQLHGDAKLSSYEYVRSVNECRTACTLTNNICSHESRRTQQQNLRWRSELRQVFSHGPGRLLGPEM